MQVMPFVGSGIEEALDVLTPGPNQCGKDSTFWRKDETSDCLFVLSTSKKYPALGQCGQYS